MINYRIENYYVKIVAIVFKLDVKDIFSHKISLSIGNRLFFFLPQRRTPDKNSFISFLSLFLLVTNHRMTNKDCYLSGKNRLSVDYSCLLEGQGRRTGLSASTRRTRMHSHAISRSLACLAGITRNAHGSQLEFRSVGG